MSFRVNNPPDIVDAYSLGGYKLFIEWDGGEQTIFDASKHMNAPTALPFRPQELFDKVQVDPMFLYWGDKQEFMIMSDEIYEYGIPFSEREPAESLTKGLECLLEGLRILKEEYE